MKAWLLKDFGLKNLHLGEVPTPVPQAGELLVKVGAVSLNYRDKAIVDGFYEPHMVPKPLIPVSDAAGAVAAVGQGVSRFKIGDRVNSTLYSRWIDGPPGPNEPDYRSEEHTSELQSLMRISYAVFCLQKKTIQELFF